MTIVKSFQDILKTIVDNPIKLVGTKNLDEDITILEKQKEETQNQICKRQEELKEKKASLKKLITLNEISKH
jgi:ribosomal protein L22